MHHITYWVSLLGSGFLLYETVQLKSMMEYNMFIIVCTILVVMVILNGYHLFSSMKEHFDVPQLVINIDDAGFYPDRLNVQTGNEVIWENQSSTKKQLTGDLIGMVILNPGDRFNAVYNRPGKFRFNT